MSDEIDLLMDIDPLEMSAKNVDDIIAYMREQQRKNLQGGIRPKKAEGPKKTIDLASLGLSKKAPEAPIAPIKRRGF